jgi:hypothetical protein
MALKVVKKFIESNAVDETKILLSNNANLKASNAANDGTVDLFKVNTSDEVEFASLPKFDGSNVATEDYVDTEISALAGAFKYVGAWDASLNSPALSNGTGTSGNVYRVTVAGTHDFGAGDIDFEAGDKVVYNDAGIWEKWDVIDNEFATSDTDDLAEGSTNLYHTDARAKSAAVVNLTDGSETDMAPSVAAIKSYIAGEIAGVSQDFGNEVIALTGTDITNEYITLAQAPVANSLHLSVDGMPSVARLGTDYTVTGAQVDFLAPLMALLESGDIVIAHYAY